MSTEKAKPAPEMPFKLDEETIELAVRITVARLEAERQLKEFIADPTKAQALAEYARMQSRIFRRALLEVSNGSKPDPGECNNASRNDD